MNEYVMPTSQRTLFLGGMVLGIVCLALSWFVGADEFHTRFWTNLLHNTVFFTGISFMALFFICVCITAWAGWYTLFKRIWEALSMFMIIGFVIMVIIGLGNYFGFHHLYHWNDADSILNDKIINHKSKFLNKNVYFIGGLIVMAGWYICAMKLRSLSLAEDRNGDDSYEHHHKARVWAAGFLPFAGFSSAFIIWQWIMSLDAHWYSTMFAWYSGASWFVSMIALTILIIIYMKSRGYYEQITNEHVHDLGKFLFAFSIFWTYLWFSQFMLIWYANVGEETVYFRHRMDNYPVLFYGNLLINFVMPFFVLMRNDTKRKFGSVGFVAAIVLFGHWWDYFLMIKPGALHTAHELAGHGHGGDHGAGAHAGEAVEHAAHFVSGFTLPGLLEIGVFIGFLSGFLYFVYVKLSQAPLVPENDPYLAESIHHHV